MIHGIIYGDAWIRTMDVFSFRVAYLLTSHFMSLCMCSKPIAVPPPSIRNYSSKAKLASSLNSINVSSSTAFSLPAVREGPTAAISTAQMSRPTSSGAPAALPDSGLPSIKKH